jgi:hypothetical protein
MPDGLIHQLPNNTPAEDMREGLIHQLPHNTPAEDMRDRLTSIGSDFISVKQMITERLSAIEGKLLLTCHCSSKP